MVSDPFAPPHSTNDLVSSTSMTSVTEEAMDHAGQQAAALVGGKATGRSPRSGKKTFTSNTAATIASAEPAERSVEPVYEPEEVTGDTLPAPAPPSDGLEAGHGLSETAAEASLDTGREAEEELSNTVVAIEARIEDVAASVEETSTDGNAVLAFRSKFAEAFQSNMEASLTYWMSLMRVASPAEAVELNNRHLRRQMEAFVAQSRELTALAQKAAMTSMRVVRDGE